MHSLSGDRFLKKFVGAILHRHRHTPTDKSRAEPGDREGMMIESANSEKQDGQDKEVQNIENTDEVTKPLNQKDELDQFSGATQPLDEPEQKTEKEIRS